MISLGSAAALRWTRAPPTPATVKKHDEYKGRKQTVVTRVTTWTEEGLAAHKAKEQRKAARVAKKKIAN